MRWGRGGSPTPGFGRVGRSSRHGVVVASWPAPPIAGEDPGRRRRPARDRDLDPDRVAEGAGEGDGSVDASVEAQALTPGREEARAGRDPGRELEAPPAVRSRKRRPGGPSELRPEPAVDGHRRDRPGPVQTAPGRRPPMALGPPRRGSSRNQLDRLLLSAGGGVRPGRRRPVTLGLLWGAILIPSVAFGSLPTVALLLPVTVIASVSGRTGGSSESDRAEICCAFSVYTSDPVSGGDRDRVAAAPVRHWRPGHLHRRCSAGRRRRRRHPANGRAGT